MTPFSPAISIQAYPLDLVRTRLAAQTTSRYYNGIWHALSTIVRDEGMFGLYRGLGATLTQVGPSLAMNYCAYETLRSYWVAHEPNLQSPTVSWLSSADCTSPLCSMHGCLAAQQWQSTSLLTFLNLNMVFQLPCCLHQHGNTSTAHTDAASSKSHCNHKCSVFQLHFSEVPISMVIQVCKHDAGYNESYMWQHCWACLINSDVSSGSRTPEDAATRPGRVSLTLYKLRTCLPHHCQKRRLLRLVSWHFTRVL